MVRPTSTLRRWAQSGLAGLAAVLLGTSLTGPAQAQFSWFGPSEASPQDIYDTISDHGFRLVGPLYRNGRVYVADVIDRRQRRERLVIAADDGRIVQRFFVDTGGPRQIPPTTPDRARSAARDDDSFFSHLTRGWDDDAPPRPPVGLPGQVDPQPAPPRARTRPEPRVVTRTDVAPVTASPLPAPAPDKKPDAGATASAPAGAPPPTGGGRATTISNDPLRIPGTRKNEDAKSATPPTAVATVKPEPAKAEPVKPEPAKPAPAKPAEVPVAPLD